MQFQAYEKDCLHCGMRKRCLRNANQHTPRQINVTLDITKEQKVFNGVFNGVCSMVFNGVRLD